MSGCGNKDGTKPQTRAPESDAAEKHYDVAVGSFHNQMFEDAKLQLDKALRIEPSHAQSHYLLGVLLLNEGKTIVDAIEIEQCLTDEAASQQRDRARRLHQQAGESFAAAAEHFPDDAAGKGRAFNSLAVVSLYFEQHEKAVEEARAALAQQFYTNRYSALANLGWAYYQQGDFVSATAELRQAILLNEDYCVGHYRLAQVYLEHGLNEQALSEAQTVIEDPRCPIQDAHRLAGVAQLRQRRQTEAAAAFRSCVDLAPRSCLAQQCARLAGPSAEVRAAADAGSASAGL